jgi:CRISPR-associated protein Cas5d
MEIAGNYAMWTRPDTGDSPSSYPAPTYSAVKGIFESILWGEATEIIPRKVEICKPVVYHSYAFNYTGPLRKAANVTKGTNYQAFQTVLIDVCYKLYADVVPYKDKTGLSERSRAWDQRTTSPGHAYQAIFERRLKRGQCFSIPFLGLKEFTPSYFGPLRDETKVMEDLPDIFIPSMLRSVFPHGNHSPVDYVYDNNIKIHKGVLEYPERRENG